MKGRVVAGLMAFGVSMVHATPRMWLTAGTPCGACHVNPSGGEMRTELGWSSMRRTGALTYEALGAAADDHATNAWFRGSISVGGDFRLLGARLGRPEVVDTPTGTETRYPDVTWFPMQLQPYLAVRPTNELTLYGSWVVGPETFRAGEICDPVFPGMGCYSTFVLYEPAAAGLSARAGVFQPGIGVRHDDHTILIRGDAADRRTPIIPPSYAEAGAEVAWQPRQWIRGEIGAFHTGNLDESLNSVARTASLWPVAYQARVTVQPALELGGAASHGSAADAPDDFDDFDDFDALAEVQHPTVLNTWLGASAYGSGDFLTLNGFAGLGLHQGLAFLAELSRTQRTQRHVTLNGHVGASWSIVPWFVVAARAERAQTDTRDERFVVKQYVAGVEIFPIPYLEVRPEYRLAETDTYRFGQTTLQVHFFY